MENCVSFHSSKLEMLRNLLMSIPIHQIEYLLVNHQYESLTILLAINCRFHYRTSDVCVGYARRVHGEARIVHNRSQICNLKWSVSIRDNANAFARKATQFIPFFHASGASVLEIESKLKRSMQWLHFHALTTDIDFVDFMFIALMRWPGDPGNNKEVQNRNGYALRW